MSISIDNGKKIYDQMLQKKIIFYFFSEPKRETNCTTKKTALVERYELKIENLLDLLVTVFERILTVPPLIEWQILVGDSQR